MNAGVSAYLDDHEVPVRGFLHTASSPSADALVLAHGAGGDCEMPLLVLLAEALAAAGLNVLRCDLPFRQKRPKGHLRRPVQSATRKDCGARWR